MSRFPAPAPKKPGARPTTNLAGGDAFDRSPRVALASLVLTSLVQDTYYQSAEKQLEDLARIVGELASRGDLLFAAKAAIYARREHGLRSISHALAGRVAIERAAHAQQRDGWGAVFFQNVVLRPDDMCEIAGYWLSQRTDKSARKTLPAAMKRGFARVFEGLSAHALSKYDGASTRSMTLRQLAHLVHPKGGKDTPVYALRGGTLPPAKTWEVAITRAGQVDSEDEVEVRAAKAGAWRELLVGNKLGYFALLRNLRNLLRNVPDQHDLICKRLIDPAEVNKSLVLPFQFLAAYEAIAIEPIPHQRAVLGALDLAMSVSLSNVPVLEGTTLVALDDSGSMMKPDLPFHKKPAIVGSLFAAALLRRMRDVDLMLFSEDARYVSVPIEASMMHVVSTVTSNLRPLGTNFNAIFETCARAYDRIVILSDEQGWMGISHPTKSRRMYEERFACKPMIYSWDLVGSTTSMFPERKVAALAGLSGKTFTLMQQLESDPNAMVNAIDAVQL